MESRKAIHHRPLFHKGVCTLFPPSIRTISGLGCEKINTLVVARFFPKNPSPFLHQCGFGWLASVVVVLAVISIAHERHSCTAERVAIERKRRRQRHHDWRASGTRARSRSRLDTVSAVVPPSIGEIFFFCETTTRFSFPGKIFQGQTHLSLFRIPSSSANELARWWWQWLHPK